jgi:hypothetical protein
MKKSNLKINTYFYFFYGNLRSSIRLTTAGSDPHETNLQLRVLIP